MTHEIVTFTKSVVKCIKNFKDCNKRR